MNNSSMSKVFIRRWLLLLIAIAAYIGVHGANAYHFSEEESMHIEIANEDSRGRE